MEIDHRPSWIKTSMDDVSNPSRNTYRASPRVMADSYRNSTRSITSEQAKTGYKFHTTDSNSSIAFLGKRITREYKSAFVLPDENTVSVTHKEIFHPEDASVEVSVNLSYGGPSPNDIKSKTYQFKKPSRVLDHLDDDSWAQAMLCGIESKDAELLGHIGNEYSNSPERFNVERKQRHRKKEETVLLREKYSDQDDDNESSYFPSGKNPTQYTRGGDESRRRPMSPASHTTNYKSDYRRTDYQSKSSHQYANLDDTPKHEMHDMRSRKQEFDDLRKRWDEKLDTYRRSGTGASRTSIFDEADNNSKSFRKRDDVSPLKDFQIEVPVTDREEKDERYRTGSHRITSPVASMHEACEFSRMLQSLVLRVVNNNDSSLNSIV
ncbi:hypothetical protein Ciccas_001004 [Cichlidogyrus casuarinus]|uniref:Uncharacterized protein n=1 Tax=Cichlidogyrus casuarinus TaxID=1844966 RepID=A0ABD2QL91_9PLAT